MEETAGLAAKLLGALGAAHDAGTVHRDVKPANVMLRGTGEALLADFGIAVHHADTTLTTAGAVIGSMEYMAPERARGWRWWTRLVSTALHPPPHRHRYLLPHPHRNPPSRRAGRAWHAGRP